MKKFSVLFLTVLFMFLLSGCGGDPAAKVEKISDWSFQYNEGTQDYSLFFTFTDSADKEIAAEANVNVKIVDNDGNILYKGKRFVKEDDFSSYTNEIMGTHFMADLRIKESSLKPGTSTDGKVYFKVYNEEAFEFDECSSDIFFDLPIRDITIHAEGLPMELRQKNYDGSVSSKVRVDDVSYTVDKSMTPLVTVTISGEKTYSGDMNFGDMFDYKLYDSDGYMVESGMVMLDQMDVGDKFKDDSIMFFELTPGETYTLKFSDTEY